MYKAVVLDLDGTLIDTTSGVIYAVEETIKRLNLTMPDDEILKSFVGPPMQLSFEKYYKMNKEDALSAAILFRKIYKEESLFRGSVYPQVLETLAILKRKGYKLAVATNKSHENAMAILKHFCIYDLCDYAEGSDMYGRLNKIDIILNCCKAMLLQPRDCVYVGDSIFDLEGAEECEMDFVAVTYGFGFKIGETVKGKTCIGTISEFKDLINMFFV